MLYSLLVKRQVANVRFFVNQKYRLSNDVRFSDKGNCKSVDSLSTCSSGVRGVWQSRGVQLDLHLSLCSLGLYLSLLYLVFLWHFVSFKRRGKKCINSTQCRSGRQAPSGLLGEVFIGFLSLLVRFRRCWMIFVQVLSFLRRPIVFNTI